MFQNYSQLMDFVWNWMLYKENLVNFDDVIQRLFHKILSIMLKSIVPMSWFFKFKLPCRKNEYVNQELFKRHFNKV